MTAQASDADRRALVRPAWLEATVADTFTALDFGLTGVLSGGAAFSQHGDSSE